MNAQQCEMIFYRLSIANPSPLSELEWHTPYELLVAVALSAQTTDKSVNKVTKTLFASANTPQKMLKLGIEGIKTQIRSIGLYNNKARNLWLMSQQLLEQFNGEVPQTREALESLAGVGRKTANVVLNVVFKQPTIAVDTHIFRVCNRTQIAAGKTVRQVEDKLMRVVPQKYQLNAHHWLILHGRYTCTAHKPHCPQCIIADLCEYTAKTTI